MQKLSTALLATTITIVATTGSAYAVGGGGEAEEIREKVRKELAAQRANAGGDCDDATVWEMLFGHDEAVAVQDAPPAGS